MIIPEVIFQLALIIAKDTGRMFYKCEWGLTGVFPELKHLTDWFSELPASDYGIAFYFNVCFYYCPLENHYFTIFMKVIIYLV